MKLVIFGLTVTSSWGNGHATTWRGLLNGLAARVRMACVMRSSPHCPLSSGCRRADRTAGYSLVPGRRLRAPASQRLLGSGRYDVGAIASEPALSGLHA